jgi:hypothetical protein
MSKQILGAIIALVLIIGIGGYFVYGKKGTDSLKNTEETAILLYVEDGDVSYKTPESGSFVKATTSPTTITDGTLVYTGIGHASILFPNNSNVSLDTYTELTVHYKDDKISLLQTLGTTYHRVEALITGGSYEVETPGTLAAVRGTKFAVKYDGKTKVTKVAVTEHQVFVAKIKEGTGTTTKEIVESLTVIEGNTARLEATTKATSSISVVDTNTDTEMKAWVEVHKTGDRLQESLKEEGKSQEEVRSEVIKSFQKEETTPSESKTEEEVAPETRKEETQTKEPTTTETKPKPTTEVKTTTTTNVTVTVKKIDSDAFFDAFNTKFFEYFYLDEKDTPCESRLTASEKVKNVTSYASESGYPFTSRTLLDFAQAVEMYCKDKDAGIKVKLQGRFDAEFPYQENI